MHLTLNNKNKLPKHEMHKIKIKQWKWNVYFYLLFSVMDMKNIITVAAIFQGFL